jgi:adenylylsulfate kinase-like enzyme
MTAGRTVIWLTGLSGSGKSTLGRALRDLIAPVEPVVLLDGDAVRAAMADGLGYSEADRTVQIGRMARLARLLADQGVLVIVAALYASDELLSWNRANLPGYIEIYLRADVEALAGCDAKGLYLRARRGEVRDVVGVDIPWHAPASPDLIVDVEDRLPPERLARRVVELVPELAVRLAPAVTEGEW